MGRSLYVAGSGPVSGKSAIALGLYDAMARRVGRVAAFRPVVRARHLDPTDPDPLLALLRARYGSSAPYADCIGVSEADLRDHEEAIERILPRVRELERSHEAVLVIGSDFTDATAPVELGVNALIALNLSAPVLPVVSGSGLDAGQVVDALQVARDAVRRRRGHVLALVANRVAPEQLAAVQRAAAASPALADVPVRVLPEEPLLFAPTVRHVMAATQAEPLPGHGDAAGMDNEARRILVAAMRLPHVLDRLSSGDVVIVPSDREEVIVGLLAAQRAGTFPSLAGLVLTGGYELEPSVVRLIDDLAGPLPVALSKLATYEVISAAMGTPGALTDGSTAKVDAALALAGRHLGAADLLDRLALERADVVTPLMFEHQVVERAGADRRRIVLPESTEPRVLRAAERTLRLGTADVLLLGDPAAIAQAATMAGVDVSAATVLDPREPALRERLAAEYARRRSHKGITLDMARDVVQDATYAGTLLVALGEADGMVSGAEHTTAHTVRPALELLRADSGGVVSSVFLMCLPDRVLAYGDCAVIPDPTAEQLAHIAVDSARTAAAFGIEPRVALLSYSTGESGGGADVDKVREATRLAHERAPDLLLEGPLQYDAAVDPGVARAKAPGSVIAGRATVLVFPDLNAGNNTYKAVQRSAGAVAVGPVLQGLARPVNDLSRGGTVDDIVLTIAVTAVQAGTGA